MLKFKQYQYQTDACNALVRCFAGQSKWERKDIVSRTKVYSVHYLVLLTFVWWREWKIINHIDWDKLNNNINNLEYCTYSYNNWHTCNILNKKTKNIIVWEWKNCHNSKQIFVYLNWEYMWEFWWCWEISRKFDLQKWSIHRSMKKQRPLFWYKFILWWEKWKSTIVYKNK